MLFGLLDETMDRVRALDPPACLEPFTAALIAARPGLRDELTDRLNADGAGSVLTALARAQLDLVIQIPELAGAMRRAVEARSVHPAVRCAMVGALAYLVQPRDLIPDDAPGGYGYVDDCLILRATLGEYFDALPSGFADPDTERQRLLLLAAAAPADRLALFQGAVDGVWHLFQRLVAMPPDQADETATGIIADPLGMPLPVQGPTPPYGAGPDIMHPPGGGSFEIVGEGVKVVFPGGGELLL